jgi:hypothetical protein
MTGEPMRNVVIVGEPYREMHVGNSHVAAVHCGVGSFFVLAIGEASRREMAQYLGVTASRLTIDLHQ